MAEPQMITSRTRKWQLRAMIKERDLDAKAKSEEILRLTDENSRLTQRVSIISRHYKEANEFGQRMVDKVGGLKQQVVGLEEENSGLKAHLDSLGDTIRNYRNNYYGLQQSMTYFADRTETLTDETSKQRARLVEQEIEISRLKATIDAQKLEITKWKLVDTANKEEIFQANVMMAIYCPKKPLNP